MQNNPSIKFKIIGHTDSDGDNNSNQILSEKRAESVKNYLISNFNIFSKNLIPEGKGESNPVKDNNTLDGKAENRRVEFVKI
jgi:outer membrane protein OmpA-like peptidoglycan-associated protein